MKFNILKIVFVIFGFSISSCIKRPSLTRYELSGYNVYKKNDTIIFQNLKTNSKDTTIIVNKKKYHHYEPMINSKYIFHYANSEYRIKSIKSPYSPDSAFMFLLCKRNNSQINPIRFNYLKSSFKLDEKSVQQSVTLFLSDKEIDDSYLLIYSRPKFSAADEFSPEILYWSMKYGIVKYRTFNGEIWERINW